MGHSGRGAVFGKRSEPHTVIIARGDTIRHFTVRPWMAAVAGSALAAAAVGYLLATSYLVFRDDLIGASVARQARMQQKYEDRISALRTQVDRITSRQLLDQKMVESKVTELMHRQSLLSDVHQRLSPGEAPDGPALPSLGPTPEMRTGLRAATEEGASPTFLMATETSPLLRLSSAGPLNAADHADMMFIAINESLRDVEARQAAKIAELADETYRATDGIQEALEAAGLKVEGDDAAHALGGPLVPADVSMPFEARIRDLDGALDFLEDLRSEARSLPLANPAPASSVSSTFGVRKDPLLGTPAMHSGIDFRAPVGAGAAATAAGKVVKAGWNGGYGRMVEINHGNGFSTRYAHLSRISVSEGDAVEAGQIIGKVGSSGRSTGPHLHYEVRRHGAAIDPLRFLKAGRKISRFM